MIATTASTATSPWEELALDLAVRLASAEIDSVRLEIRSQTNPRQTSLDLRLEYVGGIVKARPWLSVHVRGKTLMELLDTAQATWDSVLAAPWTLPLQPASAATVPSVLIWRSLTRPIDYGRLAVEIARDTLGVRDPARFKVRYDEVEGPPRVIPAATVSRGLPKGKVIGTCGRCGRPLRNPDYARIGIGPECIKSSSAHQRELQRLANQAERSGRRPITQAKQKLDWIKRVVDHWQLTSPRDPRRPSN